MEDENEIRRELEELGSSISGLSRNTPFEAAKSFLNALPERLTEHVHGGQKIEQTSQRKKTFQIPQWSRGLAAGLLLLVSGYVAYQMLNVANPERKVARELRRIDAENIEIYLAENGIEAGEGKYASAPINEEMAQSLADLNSAEIRAYLNEFPTTEVLTN